MDTARADASTGRTVQIRPLVSGTERSFLDGAMSAGAYLKQEHEEEEREAWQDIRRDRRLAIQRLALPFLVLATVVYAIVALISFGSADLSPAIVATVLGVGTALFSGAVRSRARNSTRNRARTEPARSSTDRSPLDS